MKKITITLLTLLSSQLSYGQISQPKLILHIVVDQLRGDLIHKHQHQFGSHGFNYLLSNGINFNNAHHPHANTTTCAGHATIATGSTPALHGIVANDWYDRASDSLMYCMDDANSRPLPTIHTKITTPGRSPVNLNASTFSDELILANKGKAFAVSLKDRGAITLAGHAGKAFWFDKSNGGFMTTDYYYAQYPAWVSAWNKQYKAQAFTWELSHNKEQYQNANSPVFKHQDQDFGQTFPHYIKNPPTEAYFKSLSRSPKADELTGEFAKQLLVNEQLGLSAHKTDYLGVSFSAVDAIGHQFGPNSLEAEDNLLRLDHTLARLFTTIDKQIGLNNTLIVLTADHGVSDTPAYLNIHQMKEVHPIDIQALSQQLRLALKKRYQLPDETLMSITPPYVYLNHAIISNHHLSLSKVSQFVADELNNKPGIFKTFVLPITAREKSWLTAKVDKMAYPLRAGDVYMVQPPFQSLGEHSENRVTHGSPWRYDSYVPLLFVNPSFKVQTIQREVYTTDIAPTLSALLMIRAPSAAVGTPLAEVLNDNEKR